jgi:hypothetical protein
MRCAIYGQAPPQGSAARSSHSDADVAAALVQLQRDGLLEFDDEGRARLPS